MANKGFYIDMLEHNLAFPPNRGEKIIYEWNIKCTPGSLLLILKATDQEGFHVAFFGSRTWVGVVDKALKQFREGEVRWKVDRYRSTIAEKEPSR